MLSPFKNEEPEAWRGELLGGQAAEEWNQGWALDEIPQSPFYYPPCQSIPFKTLNCLYPQQTQMFSCKS